MKKYMIILALSGLGKETNAAPIKAISDKLEDFVFICEDNETGYLTIDNWQSYKECGSNCTCGVKELLCFERR